MKAGAARVGRGLGDGTGAGLSVEISEEGLCCGRCASGRALFHRAAGGFGIAKRKKLKIGLGGFRRTPPGQSLLFLAAGASIPVQ